MSENVPFVREECDFILGHYNNKPEVFESTVWFSELVVLSRSQPYKNKLDLVRDVVAHDQELLSRYKFAMLVDDDMDFSKLDMPCLTSWFLDSPYLMASPWAPDKEHVHPWNSSTCPVTVTDQLTPTIMLMKMGKLQKLADMILPATIGDDGLIECDFGTVLTMCRYIGDKPAYDPISKLETSGACAYAYQCGAAMHTHIKSERSKEHWDTCTKNVMLYMTERAPYMTTNQERCEDPSLPISQ